MATTYVVLREQQPEGGWVPWGEGDGTQTRTVEANNSEQACRKAAEALGDELDKGVTLIAIPARNWTSGRHTLKAETTRRIRSA